MKIIDSHCHYGCTRDRNWCAKLEDYKELNKKYNAKFILAVFIKDAYKQMMEELEEMVKIIQKNPDLFIGLAPTASRNEPKKAIDFVSSLPKNVVRILKPLWINKRVEIDDPSAEVLVKFAIDNGWPLFYHCTHEAPEESKRVGNLAKKYPEAKLILGHFGGSRLINETFKNTIDVFSKFKNTHIDLSTLFCSGLLEKAVAIDESRILFGTDYPVHYFSAQLALIQEAKISDEVRQKILHDNIMKIIK